MPKEQTYQLIRDKLPVCYRFNQYARWLMIVLSTIVMVYSLFFLLQYVKSDTPASFKILPLIIVFVALDSILKKVTSVNSITFETDELVVKHIMKSKIEIPYSNIISLELSKKITYIFKMEYSDSQGRKKVFSTNASFPHMLEIILNIHDLSPQAEVRDKLKEIVDYLRKVAINEV